VLKRKETSALSKELPKVQTKRESASRNVEPAKRYKSVAKQRLNEDLKQELSPEKRYRKRV